jgi:3-deoxy-manno-octulosonate cytidylyltransferase (CMP-KDO synthetase)|tara:strand:+ start:83 stop:817 length:735 start_codon:yes stop_codon:yes gene_type:complete
MIETAIIIPSRLDAKRLPNKPLSLINHKEMILHVYDAARNTNIGDVYVATPDKEVMDVVKKHGGLAVETDLKHETGTDRIFEVFDKFLKRKPKIIINLQGDMPNINPKSITTLYNHMKKKLCDVGTLAGKLEKSRDEKNFNVVKVVSKEILQEENFSQAMDFFRLTNNEINKKTYHHIGIYAFTDKALIRYVELERSKFEIERKLEQMRVLENDMRIDVGYVKSSPLSIDTQEDLNEIKRIMEN